MKQLRHRKTESFSVFKVNILRVTPPSPNSVYHCHSPKGKTYYKAKTWLKPFKRTQFQTKFARYDNSNMYL